jgi:hypothetical protein
VRLIDLEALPQKLFVEKYLAKHDRCHLTRIIGVHNKHLTYCNIVFSVANNLDSSLYMLNMLIIWITGYGANFHPSE